MRSVPPGIVACSPPAFSTSELAMTLSQPDVRNIPGILDPAEFMKSIELKIRNSRSRRASRERAGQTRATDAQLCASGACWRCCPR